MKITKYPQSCLLLEKNGQRIVIDPGDDFSASYKIGELGQVEAVLYTHQHSDHYDEALCRQLLNSGAQVFANADVAGLIGPKAVKVDDGQEFEAAGFKVKAIDLPHCPMSDGSAGPHNTGYLINGSLFHPGDGFELEGFQVETLADPITGADISIRDAFDFAKQVRAKKVIPIHYDKLGAKPEVYKMFAERLQMPFEFIVLSDGQSVEL